MSEGRNTDILYHYTSNESFLGILESRSIWLSSLRQSNDSMEGLWIHRLGDEYVKREYEEFSPYSDLFTSSEEVATELGSYGFCMSEEEDQLSQWRGYAQDGTGFCIGFSRARLRGILNNFSHPESANIISVIYDTEKQKDIVLKLMDDYKKGGDQHNYQ